MFDQTVPRPKQRAKIIRTIRTIETVMSEEYISIFHAPMEEQAPPMRDWLEKHVGTTGIVWMANSPAVLCVTQNYKG